MATMASSGVLLLAAILAAVASVQGQVTAPAPSASMPVMTPPSLTPTQNQTTPSPFDGGQCTPDYISELGSCVYYRLDRGRIRGLPPLYERERCCRNVSGKQSAAECLCAAFARDPDVPEGADFAGYVNDVLFTCNEPEIPNLVCPVSTSG
ncbi:unnamed protein product [Alopecurus aequalis]